MCGIWTFINLLKLNINNNQLYNDFMNLKHRGPDLSNFQIIKNVAIGFHRLAIMDPTFNANQPYIIEDNDTTIIFICNGEIYNFKELIIKYNLIINNNSDCMTIPKLYIKYKSNIKLFSELFINEIKGEFAFILLEFDKFQNLENIVIGRDQIGIRPLFWSTLSNQKALLFSSEIKGMGNYKETISEFEPGTILKLNINIFQKINLISNYNFKNIYNINASLEGLCSEEYYLNNVRNAVINSIKRRLIADKPIAFLLSGGVDSSLVASISSKILNQSINTFCCGMKGGTDLDYARQVANHINSNHTEVYFTPEEGIQAIKDVIWTTETWDTTTIRASVGQYLVCKHIGTKTDSKVVMVGEGPDEVCSSYLFNFLAPSGEELHETAKEFVEKIHLFDGRRADRCISRWGLEGRIALLDPEFINAYWEIPSDMRHPKYKGIEKWWLRKAFENTGLLLLPDNSKLLPDNVLWRKKEAFSDGVSSKTKSWFEILQDYIKTQVSDEEFKQSNEPSIEAYYYKKIFIDFFGIDRISILPHYWQPKWTNQKGYIDPSARTLNIY